MEPKNTIDFTEKNGRRAVLFFFAAFLITGLLIFKDYGISWDEEFQWKNNGAVNYDLVAHGNSAALLEGVDKYHGPAFELLLTGIEKLFRLNDTRSIFLVRHLLTFLTFYLSAVFFYLLAFRIFHKRMLALLGAVFYVLSPHIFSHAFYNSKDIVFLSLFTISIYCMLQFLERRTYLRAFIFALVTAFTIDVRIIGILIPGVFIYLLFTGWLRRKQAFEWKLVLIYFLCLVPLIILFWPVLWIDPLFHFKEALKENSHYPWDDRVLYFGKEYTPTSLPWHYLFFWMFVSRPVLYTVFFLLGVSSLAWKLFRKPLHFIRENTNEQVVLCWFFLPLLAMLVFKSPAFDTGRHLYFLHGAFVLLMLFGLQCLWQFAARRRIAAAALSGLTGISLIFLVFSMCRLHPYEHLYFNITQGTDEARIKSRFEYDYWGLSQRALLEQLLKADPSERIVVQAEHLPGRTNAYLLPAAERARIRFANGIKRADYFLADYRWKKEGDYPFHTEVFSQMNGNAKVATLFKVHSAQELYKTHGKVIMAVDNAAQGRDTVVFNSMEKLAGNGRLLLKTYCRMHADPGATGWYVVRLETKEGRPYFWYPLYTLRAEGPDSPGEIHGALELPLIRRGDDKMKVYFESTGKGEVRVEDVQIGIEEQEAE
ncbi:MAG: hypothetical protein JWO09_1939 [Bacteroidetes bacterium]|nr:hypothetical protein [Bacteroidota bacterium]